MSQSNTVSRTRSGVGRSPAREATASGLRRHLPPTILTTPLPALDERQVAKLEGFERLRSPIALLRPDITKKDF